MSNILEILQAAPAKIAEENVRVIESEKTYKLAKARLSASRNAFTVVHRGEKNSRLIEAMVENEPDIQVLVIAEIEAEASMKMAKNRADGVYNSWVSARKIAGLDERELHSISGSTIKIPQ